MRHGALAQPVVADHLVIDRLAHSVQALELVVGVARQRVDGRDRERVVARELRVQRVGRGEHRLRAGKVRHIGMHLAREHRIVGQAVDLRALDFGIPVRAFHQPHHQPAVVAACERDQPIDHRTSALLIGLHDEAQTVPAFERGIGGQRREKIERKIQPVRFLGIDVEADVVAPRELRETGHARPQLREHALALRSHIAWMQRGQLDRDAGSRVHAGMAGRRSDRMDRVLVGGEIAARVGVGERRLAQHVERKSIAARFPFARVRQRFLDRPAEHELLAEQAHREIDALADERFSTFAQQRSQRLFERAVAARIDELARDEQSPRRGVHEQRRAAADVRVPVARSDLVADQPIARGRVRNPQQRLGEAHERDPFARIERELEHQRIDAARLVAFRAHGLRKCRRQRLRGAQRAPRTARPRPGAGPRRRVPRADSRR